MRLYGLSGLNRRRIHALRTKNTTMGGKASPLLGTLALVSGMSGLRLDRPKVQTMWTALFILFSAIIGWVYVTTPLLALIYVVVEWCVYYLGHILFFRFKLHHRLRKALGDERAWATYESVLGVVFFNLGWSLAMFLRVHADTMDVTLPSAVAMVLGGALFFVSVGVKTWATHLVGMDVYYYRDLFHDRAGDGALVTTGPYAVFANPMYGIGNVSMHGAALEAASVQGWAVAIVFHISIYVFYLSVERPFMRRVYGSGD